MKENDYETAYDLSAGYREKLAVAKGKFQTQSVHGVLGKEPIA